MMRGMTRRRWLATLAATGALAPACGGAGQQAPAAAKPLPPKITFVIAGSAADYSRYWQPFAKWFEAEHPGTTVDAVLPPTDAAYQVKLYTLLASGTTPDLFHLNNKYIRDFYGRGLLQPFDPYVKPAGLPVADIIPGALAPYRIAGKLFGIPRDNSTAILFYNKDLFAAAALKEPDSTWTRDTYLEAARKLTDVDRQRFGSAMLPVDTVTEHLQLSILRSFGADWYDAAMREAHIGSPAAMQAFALAADMRLRQHMVPRPGEAPAADQFVTQTVAMQYTGQANVQSVKRAAPGFRWDVAPTPKGPGGRINVVGSTGYCLPKSAPQPEAAAVLLRFLLEERVARDMMSEGRWTVTRKAYLPLAVPADGLPSRYTEAVVERQLASEGIAMPVGFDDMITAFKDETAPAWLGDRSLQQAVATAAERWTQILHQNPQTP